MFAPGGANSPPARRSRAIRFHLEGCGPPNLWGWCGREVRRRSVPGGTCRVSCPRLLNHSRFPDGMPLPFMPAQSSRRARGAPTARFAVRLRVALRFAQQPTGLTLPFGALMVSLPRFGSLWAFGPSAHRARASLRAFQALETLAPPPFAAKTAHATASVGWVWDPPASERRPREYRAQHGPRPRGAGHAQQHNTAHSMDRAFKARDMRSNFFPRNG